MEATAIQETAPASSEVQRKREPLEPYAIKVPDSLTAALDQAVELMSKRLGESPEDVRRFVEVAVLQRGIRAVAAEEGKR